MPLYDFYEEFRNPELTALEQERLRAASGELDRIQNTPGMVPTENGFRSAQGEEVLDPMVEAHVRIAVDRAYAQLQQTNPMPEDVEGCIRFPGIDPWGKYSIIDMKFAQREAQVRAALETRTPAVRNYVQGMLDAIEDPSGALGAEFKQVWRDMTAVSIEHRVLTRGSKLCLNERGRKVMHQRARAMEVSAKVTDCDKLMQGLEYASGLLTGPIPQEISRFFQDRLHMELSPAIVAEAAHPASNPQMEVTFQYFSHKTYQAAFANPRNWGKPEDQLWAERGDVDLEMVDNSLPPYAIATAGRVLDPAFEEAERLSGGEFSRGDLIAVDGRTIREIMQEQFAAGGGAGSFDDYYRQHVNHKASELVAAGLMAGKRVESFIPDRRGVLPEAPAQIIKGGYAPTELEPVHLNRWERFFSKRGFYKEKTARKEEYDRVMAARERIKARGEAVGRTMRMRRVNSTLARREALCSATAEAREMFFGPAMDALEQLPPAEKQRLKIPEEGFKTLIPDQNGGNTQVKREWGKMNIMVKDDWGGKGAFGRIDRSEAVDTCVCYLLAQGHSFTDIMDPGKLQDQRREAAGLFLEKARANDQDWLGRVFYAGQKAIRQQVAAMTQGIQMKDEAQLLAALPQVETMLHVGFGVSQMLNVPACRRSFFLAAAEEANGDLARGNRLAEQLDGAINDGSNCASNLLTGLRAQMRIAAPGAGPVTQVDMVELAMMRMSLDNLKQGDNFMEQSAFFAEQNFDFTNVAYSSEDLPKIAARLSQPENVEKAREMAASGALIERLGCELYRRPVMRKGEHVMRQAEVYSLEPDAQNQLQIVKGSRPTPAFAAAGGFKFDFAPGAERQAPQRQAPERNAGQNPQLGGPGRG